MGSTLHEVDGKRANQRGKSPRPKGQQPPTQVKPTKSTTYASDGVKDNDILMLPASDYGVLAVLTGVALVVRLFRIYQPTSVVFDEVQ